MELPAGFELATLVSTKSSISPKPYDLTVKIDEVASFPVQITKNSEVETSELFWSC